jgi:hypothetical protein
VTAPALAAPPISNIRWPEAFRIIRSRFPPIDLFEDIADPADWDALASAEMKTNPRYELLVGRLDLVPVADRVAGPGSTWVMAPFTHISTDRPSRFSNGTFGVYYAANSFEGALAETMRHHALFMARTAEEPGWTSDFRELIGEIDAGFHDVRADANFAACLDPDSYVASQALGDQLRAVGSNGVAYPSVRHNMVGIPRQGRHLAYHWDGVRVDQLKDVGAGTAFLVGGT